MQKSQPSVLVAMIVKLMNPMLHAYATGSEKQFGKVDHGGRRCGPHFPEQTVKAVLGMLGGDRPPHV